MAYDEDLAHRIRGLLGDEQGITEQAMFGGLAFLVHGNMAVAAAGKGGLMLRIDPASADAAVLHPHVERKVMGGRSMDGWLQLDDPAFDADDDLARWVAQGIAFARGLPPKPRRNASLHPRNARLRAANIRSVP